MDFTEVSRMMVPAEADADRYRRIESEKKHPPHAMCAERLRIGRTAGQPCPNRASRVVGGVHLCGTHARLTPEGRFAKPARGFWSGKQLMVTVGFKPDRFAEIQQMATDKGSSFGSMTRTLVDYAMDEISLQTGQNRLETDGEG